LSVAQSDSAKKGREALSAKAALGSSKRFESAIAGAKIVSTTKPGAFAFVLMPFNEAFPNSVTAYKGYNNIIAYCDPAETHRLNKDWVGAPDTTQPLCPSSSGATRYTYDFSDTANEPFGRLTDSYSPCYGGVCGASNPGKHENYAYDTASQGGDFGLPTTVTVDCSNQYDGSQNCPIQTFGYAPNGTLTSYGTGSGTWTLGYDSDNRLITSQDPDGIVDRKCYMADGSVQATQTAAQYALDGSVSCGSHSVSYTYDLDGNKLSETHHFNNTAGVTNYWYDGDDRVVEVGEPHDSANDYYSYNWLTRNIYDISQGQMQTIGTVSGVKAYGNLYKTEEWFGPTTKWVDIKGQAFDALDRAVEKYSWWSGHSPETMVGTSYSYDASNDSMGLLSKRTDALSQVTNYSYDADSHLWKTWYLGDGGVTPSETYAVDEDGRNTSITSSTMGIEAIQYDADGLVKSTSEPSGGGVTSNATYTYTYDHSGRRSELSATASALVNGPLVLQYAYRADGLRTGLSMAYGSMTGSISWNRQASGRVASISDSSAQPARTFTYQNGQVVEDKMPSADITGMQYDAEGELTSYTYPLGTTTMGYTVRGELTSQVYSNQQYDACNPTPDGASTYSPLRQKAANGTTVPITQECLPPATFRNEPAIFWDDHSGANLGPSLPGPDSVDMSYDQANRQNTAVDNWEWTHTGGDGTTSTQYGTSTLTRTYDAENHLLGEVSSGDNWDITDFALKGCMDPWHNLSTQPQFDTVNLGYAWGPNGHPAMMDGYSVHWDGDSPLFVTTSSGALEEIKVEGLAIGDTSWKFLDRNQSGYVVASHWAGGHSDWSPASASHQTCGGATLSGDALLEPGPDGIGDGYNILQGVRNYDPQLGQWSSPDAYAGDAADPMSQKAYMWNRGNPFMYEDPSGYLSVGDVYNFFVGDDIHTLRDSKASGLAKVGAALSLAVNLIPDGKGLEVVGKAVVKLTEKQLLKSAGQRASEEIAKHGLEEGSMIVRKFPNGDVKINYTDAAGDSRAVMGHNSHGDNAVHNFPHTQLEHNGELVEDSHKEIIQ
jgi:YD repeat-containing protein